VFCARCGQQVPEASQYCPSCGQPVNWSWQATPPSPAPGAAPGVGYPPPAPPTAYAAQGVGGALLFFCICITILWPLWVLSQYARFNFRMSPLAVVGLLRLVFGVLVGIMLWTRQSAAMVLLRIHLGITALFTAYNLINLLMYMMRYQFSPFAAWRVFYSFAVSLIFLGGVVIYFSVSERVRATYASKLFG